MTVILPTKLNERQRIAYGIMHPQQDIDADVHEPLRMMHGTAGTGKSWLLNALSHLLVGRLGRSALSGMAAFLTGGSTLHSLLKFSNRGGNP